MTTVSEKAQKLSEGRDLSLNKSDYIFQRVVYKNNLFVVYEIMSKAKPIYALPEDESEEEWRHSSVIRMTKLPDDEDQIKALFDLFETRVSIKGDDCPDLLTFYDQGLTQYGDDVYHLARYDNPVRTFDHFINIDHRGVEIDHLDCFRLLRGVLSAFAYLEENGYVLTQFDDQNLYVGSFSEDRGCFFRIMFKGHRDKSSTVLSLQKRHKLSPPETESSRIYRSFGYSAGLMVLYAIYNTHKRGDDFPAAFYKDLSQVKDVINTAANLLYKSEKDVDMKELFIVFLEDLLRPNTEDRPDAKELLTYKYIMLCDQQDYEEYTKEFQENERAKQKAKDDEEQLN